MYDVSARNPADLRHAVPEVPDLLREIHAPMPRGVRTRNAGKRSAIQSICRASDDSRQ